MAVEVMMFGGRRDGEILEVPSDWDDNPPKSIQLTIFGKDIKGDILEWDKKILTIDIVPRYEKPGPRWKVELPKELW